MTIRSSNPQMFALPSAPPGELTVGGRIYRLDRVFKHDFWAATCLYEQTTNDDGCRVQDAGTESVDSRCSSSTSHSPRRTPHFRYSRLVVKFGRSHGFAGVPLRWVGEMLTDHEEAIYRRLAGLDCIPGWAGRLDAVTCAIEFVEAVPLDHLAPEDLPAEFFDRLRKVFDAVHARGIAYGDANKKSNILVRDGWPVLIDFQIALRTRDDWPAPLRGFARRVVRYLQGKDLYHLYKHKRRIHPQHLTPAEEALSRRRSPLHKIHRRLTKPYRALRRRVLGGLFRKGLLHSPTADLEDHHQPEKDSWRTS